MNSSSEPKEENADDRSPRPAHYLFVIAAAALGGLLSVPLNPLSAALMAAIAFVGVYAHKVLLPQINSTRDSQLAGDSAGRWHFATLHRFSVALNFAQFAIAAYVLYRFPSIAR